MPRAKALDPNLKVVKLPTAALISQQQAAEPTQLELSLDANRLLILIATEQLHGATLLRALVQMRPKVVLDLRFAPHFNFTGIPRSFNARSFESFGTKYIWQSVPFHEFRSNFLRHNPKDIAEKILGQVFHEAKVTGPIVLLLQDLTDLRAFAPYFVGSLERTDNARWNVAEVF